MPTRLLRDWTDSARVEHLSAEAERLFVRLIMRADDYGRFHADPRLVSAACLPLVRQVTDERVESWIGEIHAAGLVSVYQANGRKFLEIANFGQRTRAQKSKFPDIDGQVTVICPQAAVKCAPNSDAYAKTYAKTEAGAKPGETPPPVQTTWTPLPEKHTELEALKFAKASHRDLARASEPHLSGMLHKYAANPAKRARALNEFATHYAGDATIDRGTATSKLENYLKREFEDEGKGDAPKAKREAWQIKADADLLREKRTQLGNRYRFDYNQGTKNPVEFAEYQELQKKIQALDAEAAKAAGG